MTHNLPPFLTVEQAADYTAMDDAWVYRQCRMFRASRGREGCPCKMFGRSVRIPTSDFLKWIDSL